MVNITKHIIFEAEIKPGRKNKNQTKENSIKCKLEYDLYINYLKKKQLSCIFYLLTIQTFHFNNLLNLLSQIFDNIVLEITSERISIINGHYKYFKKMKQPFQTWFSLFSFKDYPITLIESSKCELYNCSSDKVIVNLNASELSILNNFITPCSLVRLFIDNSDYNAENKEASNIEFHIFEEQNDTLLFYNSIVFDCKKYVDTEKNEENIIINLS